MYRIGKHNFYLKLIKVETFFMHAMQSQQFSIYLTETIKMLSNKFKHCIAVMTSKHDQDQYGRKINCRYKGMINLYTLLSR